MAKRSLILTGDKKINRMLNALASPRARAIHRQAMRKAVRPILAEAKARSPVKSGKLRASLTIKAAKRSRKSIGVLVTQKEGAFKGETFYGSFLEFGYKRGKRRKELRRKGATDSRRKIPGLWTMKQSADEKQNEAIDIYEAEVMDLIETEARK